MFILSYILEVRIEYKRVSTTVTHAVQQLLIFCAALWLMHSAALHLEQNTVSC